SHNTLALLLRDNLRRPEAEVAYRQALAIQEKLVAHFTPVSDYRNDLATYLHNLAIVLGADKRDETEATIRRAMAIDGKLAADFPAQPEYRQGLAFSHSTLAALLSGWNRPAEAEDALRQALAIREKLAA